jgi:hypothetical protein
VFEDKALLLQTLKNYKDARFKSFKSRSEALKFARNGTNPAPSILDVLKCKSIPATMRLTHEPNR